MGVRSEMSARVSSQYDKWIDPHNNGTYAITDSSDSSLSLTRRTGNGRYTDKMKFVFKAAGSGCQVFGCSESQVTSVYDAGTNYCNLRMLYCGSADGCHPVGNDL